MGKVLEMEEQKRHLTAKRGYESWKRRFSETFDPNAAPVDLSDAVLAALIEGSEESSMALYELIMGFLGLGKGPRFYSLEAADIITVTDITLFLLDQLRFESMRRLQWIDDWPTVHIPLLDLVEQFSTRYSPVRHQTPRLSTEHPRFAEYQEAFEGDRDLFIRRLIPDAIKCFEEKKKPR